MSKIYGELNAEMMKNSKVIHQQRAALFQEMVGKTGSQQSVLDRLLVEIEQLRAENNRLKAELAEALAACEAKDTILRGITLYRAFNGDDWPATEATQALAIKPDSSALKAHDDALIERCAEIVTATMNAKGPYAHHIERAIRELKEKL